MHSAHVIIVIRKYTPNVRVAGIINKELLYLLHTTTEIFHEILWEYLFNFESSFIQFHSLCIFKTIVIKR